jgi:hypothetical protein
MVSSGTAAKLHHSQVPFKARNQQQPQAWHRYHFWAWPGILCHRTLGPFIIFYAFSTPFCLTCLSTVLFLLYNSAICVFWGWGLGEGRKEEEDLMVSHNIPMYPKSKNWNCHLPSWAAQVTNTDFPTDYLCDMIKLTTVNFHLFISS